MMPATVSRGSASAEPDTFTNRAVPDRPLQLALVLLAALLVVSVLTVAVVYYGDNFATPAWSERSVPVPRLY